MEHAGFRITLLIVLLLVTGGLIGNAVEYSLLAGRGGCGSQLSSSESIILMWVNIVMAVATAILCVYIFYKMYLEQMEKKSDADDGMNDLQSNPASSVQRSTSSRSNYSNAGGLVQSSQSSQSTSYRGAQRVASV